MKSKPPDKSLQTNCKECLFAIYNKDTQTGCMANRIDMFRNTPRGDVVIEAHDEEKEFVIVGEEEGLSRMHDGNSGPSAHIFPVDDQHLQNDGESQRGDREKNPLEPEREIADSQPQEGGDDSPGDEQKRQ